MLFGLADGGYRRRLLAVLAGVRERALSWCLSELIVSARLMPVIDRSIVTPSPNPFPGAWDLVWSSLQLVGVPFLVLLPLMFVVWVIEWIHTGRAIADGARAAGDFVSRGARPLTSSSVFRWVLLAFLLAMTVGNVWGLISWLVFEMQQDLLPRNALGETVSGVLGDPRGQSMAIRGLCLAIGICIVFVGFSAFGHVAGRYFRVLFYVYGAICLLLTAGSALLAGFGVLAYGWPPDGMTVMFIGIAALGAVGVVGVFGSLALAESMFYKDRGASV